MGCLIDDFLDLGLRLWGLIRSSRLLGFWGVYEMFCLVVFIGYGVRLGLVVGQQILA